MNKAVLESTTDGTVFTTDYLSRLRDGDHDTQHHFAWYFGSLITIKVRNRLKSPALIEEVREQTLLRVLLTLRQDDANNPHSLGTLVNSTCNRVLIDALRRSDSPAPQTGLLPRILGIGHECVLALLSRARAR